MADTNSPGGVDAALQADEGSSVPRIKMGETGFATLKSRGGKMYEEANRAFTYPNMLKVVAEMKYSPPVSIGLQAINILMNRSAVYVQPVVGETKEDKVRRDFLTSVLHDMDSSFQATMQHITTYKEYGHAVSEIVLRRRLTKNGSKYNDGLIGLADLKNRPQDSIAKWNFSEDGRKLVSISQSLVNLENSVRYASLADENGFIVIPREKFLLFRADATSDNPEGNSILKSAYLAYKQLTLLSDHMMTGVSKDISGIPFASLPAAYMSPEASDADAAVYKATVKIVTDLSQGISTGIVFPRVLDDKGNNLFDFTMLEPKTGKAFDIPAITKMLQANILSVLSCDSITMGSDKGGSLSLQDGDTNMLALQVDYRLSEIANTFNKELVPLIWKMNGWATDRLPLIKFNDISSVSLEEHSKWAQRLAAVGLIEVDRGVLNKIREVGGFELKPDDAPIDYEHLTTSLMGKSSSSGESMAVGVNGEGTAKSPGAEDKSARNVENKG